MSRFRWAAGTLLLIAIPWTAATAQYGGASRYSGMNRYNRMNRRGRRQTAPAPAPTPGMRVYYKGKWQTLSLQTMHLVAYNAMHDGGSSWRANPVMALLSETISLLPGQAYNWVAPPITRLYPGQQIRETNQHLGQSATYTVQTVTPTRITATLRSGSTSYRVVLEKPTQSVWWVTQAAPGT